MQTLCCANTVDDGLLQVTPQDVRVVDAGTGALVHQWKAPAGLQINTASASPTQVRSASMPLYCLALLSSGPSKRTGGGAVHGDHTAGSGPVCEDTYPCASSSTHEMHT